MITNVYINNFTVQSYPHLGAKIAPHIPGDGFSPLAAQEWICQVGATAVRGAFVRGIASVNCPGFDHQKDEVSDGLTMKNRWLFRWFNHEK